MRRIWVVRRVVLGVVWLGVSAWPLFPDEKPDSVEEIIRDAWKETRRADASRQRTTADAQRAKQWAARLWEYREKHSETQSATRATVEALRLLAYADEQNELMTKAGLLMPNDAAWGEVLGVLLEAAEAKGNYYFVVSRAKRLVNSSTRTDTKMHAQSILGQAYWNQEQPEKAKEAFRAVVRDYPETPLAGFATANINEIETLNPGQMAPQFRTRSIGGDVISLADFRGKVVLLDFWATWCGPCVQELPLIKDLSGQYKGEGLVVIGVSLDGNAQSVVDLLARNNGVTWPQIADGEDGPLAALFNIRKLPANYLLDRAGKIAAKRIQAASLDQTILQALKKP